MTIPFITSKVGTLTEISIHKYAFSDLIRNDVERLNKFTRWLEYQHVYEITNSHFSLFQPLNEKSGLQYEHLQSLYIEPPFNNTSRISSYLGFLLRTNFKKHYQQFLNHNIFEVESINFSPFKLIKGFEFNIEIFNNGELLIHLIPISKITSDDTLSEEFIKNLKTHITTQNIAELELNIISLERFKSFRFRMDSIENFDKIISLVTNEKYIATFDYHFLASYSPSLFGKITNETVKELEKSLDFLRPVMQKIELPKFVHFNSPKEYTKIDLNNLSTASNLLIGNNFACREHKAAYYNGVFQPISNKYILPIYAEKISAIDLFEELFIAFNKGGNNINILNPMVLNPDDEIFMDTIKDLKNEHNENLLIIIFTEYTLPKDSLKKLQKLGIQLQTYLGKADKYQMSNFCVKCIEKLGGILSIIKNTYEPTTTYFLGIDLGHSIKRNQKKSNLAFVLFDNRGILLKKYVNKEIPQNEALTEGALKKPFNNILLFLKKQNLPSPNKLIIHRDGKLHKYDLENILTKISELFDIHEVDIVEVIKSGYPIMAKYDINTKTYTNPDSGETWLLDSQKYAIMATNTQINERGAVINPIIIKHKYGNTPFINIAMQIYWFTKIYTNNLYNSTRLPATTLKANNIVSTSDVVHISSNLG